jgi:ABC-type nitrate/sulfonate/bicarbonate transport system permease component
MWLDRLLPAIFCLALLAVGEVAVLSVDHPPYLIAPSDVLQNIWALALAGGLGELASLSLGRALAGFTIGAGLGLLAGLMAGTNALAKGIFDVPVSFTYPLPKIALFPVFAVWFGFTDTARILVIALACFYPAYVNAFAGTRGFDYKYTWIARNTGAGRLRTFTQVILPASMPRAAVGLRISMAIAFILVFATETVGFAEGVGAQILRSYQNGHFDDMYSYIVVLGAMGVITNTALLRTVSFLTKGQAGDALPVRV